MVERTLDEVDYKLDIYAIEILNLLNSCKVTIHDVAPLALTLLVDFAYTGELVVSEDNVQVGSDRKDIAD